MEIREPAQRSNHPRCIASHRLILINKTLRIIGTDRN